jgi:hypothetical protein
MIMLGVGIFAFFQFFGWSSAKFYQSKATEKITDTRSEYAGSKYWEDDQTADNRIQLDLTSLKNSTGLSPATNSYYWPRPSDGVYALQTARNPELVLINLQTKSIEKYAYPVVPAGAIDYQWIGNNLLVHYYSAGGRSDVQMSRDVPRDDHFYFFNTDTKKFSPITVDAETSKYTSHAYDVYFLKESDTSKAFALVTCSDTDALGECMGYGYSVSNGTTIKKVFDLPGSWTWGWKNGSFYVKKNTDVYRVDLTKIAW